MSAEIRESHASGHNQHFLLSGLCAQLPPVGPMTRTDALDAGAARKEAYEEAA